MRDAKGMEDVRGLWREGERKSSVRMPRSDWLAPISLLFHWLTVIVIHIILFYIILYYIILHYMHIIHTYSRWYDV